MNKNSLFALVGIAVSLMVLAGQLLNVPIANAAEALADGQDHYAWLGANQVHYVTFGQAKDVVLFVHGWSCRGDFWREQVPALTGKAKIILVDLPGHGQSDKPKTAYTMDFFAQAVLAVMKDAKVEQATLAGHSMGTPVICRVYAQAPEKVAALVAVDGLLRRPKVTPEQVESFLGPYHTPEYREHAARFIAAMFPNPGTEALRDRVTMAMLQTPQYVMAGAMDGMFAAGQPAWDLAKVNVPVLVINAKNPMWTDEYESYVGGLSSRVEYRVMDGVGHFLMLEKPAEFNAVLLELLRKYDLVSGEVTPSSGASVKKKTGEAAAPAEPEMTLEDREKAIDKEHLLKIYAAIQAFKKDHGDLPDYLNELFPKYLTDEDVLMSPTEKRTGESRLFGYGDPKMKSSYIYEFSGASSGRNSENGKVLTMKEWKSQQMESFGPVTPILRLHLASKALNVAYSGDFYETATLWESDPNTIALVKKLGSVPLPKGGKRLSVTVVRADNAQPLSGALAEMTSTHASLGARAPRSAQTSEAGLAELPLDSGPIQQLALVITKEGFAPARASWDSGNIPSSYTVKLAPAITMGGTVKEQSGQVINGAKVSVFGVTKDEVGQSVENECETVLTDAQGRWKSTAVPANQNMLTIRVKHPEFMPAEFDVVNEGNSTDATLAKSDLLALKTVITLAPGIRIEGRITDTDGQALAGASVSLRYGESFNSRQYRESRSDGTYTLVMLENCEAHLVVQAKGYAPQDRYITIERGLKPNDFKMERGLTFKGQVVDSNQKGMPSVNVRLVSWNDLRLVDWSAQTDAEGRFGWDSAPPGTIALEAQMDGYYPANQSQALGPNTEFRFTLEKMFRVTGKVTDAETQQPIAKFRILWGYNYGGPDDTRANWETQNAIQGVNGAYTAVQNYRRGNRTKLMVLADGYLPGETPWMEDTGWHTHDFVLKKGSGPQGVVILPDGQPAKAAQVAFTGMGYLSLGKAAFQSYNENSEFLARTDAQGRFSLPAVMASPHLIAVHEQGYAEIEGDELAKSSKITLQPWGKVEGVLMFGTRPGAKEPIMLAPEDSGPGSINYDWGNFRCLTDDRGRFTIANVPPGSRRLVRLIQTSQNSWLWSHTESIEVKPGETLQYTYGGKGRPVIGQVALSDPKRKVDWKNGYFSLSTPYPQPPQGFTSPQKANAWYRSAEFKAAIKKHRSFGFRIKEDGSFQIENVPAGKYSLSINVNEPGNSNTGMSGPSIGNLQKEVIIPEIPGGVSDEPLDLGKLEVKVVAKPNQAQ